MTSKWCLDLLAPIAKDHPPSQMLWHVIAPEHTSPAYGQLSMLSSPHLESTIGNRTHHASRIKPARPTRSAIAGANRTNRSTIVPDAANGNEKGDDLKGKGSGGDGDGDRNGGRDRVEGPSTTEKIRSEHVKFGGSFAQGLSRHGNAMSFGSPDKAFVKGKDDVFIVHTGFDMAGLPDDNSAMDDFIDALHRCVATGRERPRGREAKRTKRYCCFAATHRVALPCPPADGRGVELRREGR